MKHPRTPLPVLLSVLFLPLAPACRSADDPYGGPAPERLLDIEARGTWLAPYERGFAIPIDESWKTNRAIPDGIRARLQSGQTHLLLQEPIVFAGAARWIVSGETPFRAEQAEVKAPHDRRDDEEERELPLRPALLVLRGTLPAGLDAAQLGVEERTDVSLDQFGLDHGIKALPSQTDRVALGRGVEIAMRLATGRARAGSSQASFDWIVTTRDGEPVEDAEWIATLDGAAGARRPYRALIRRYRPTAEPRESWFAVPLNVVVLCSQMHLSAETNGGIAWEWEGFWMGRLDRAPELAATGPSPPVRIVYAEFRSAEGQRRGGDYLSSVFDPVTRTGQTALEELRRRGANAFLPGSE